MNKAKRIDPLRTFIILILAGGLLLQFSCIQFMPGAEETKQAPSEEGAQEAQLFTSENYIIYRLVGGETPATLAERFLGDDQKAWVIEGENKGVSFQKTNGLLFP